MREAKDGHLGEYRNWVHLLGNEAETLRLSVCGSVSAQIGEQDISLKLNKSVALLAYLALGRHFHESRQRLLGLLWSETDVDKARVSLRQCIRSLRRAFEAADFAGFRADTQIVELTADCVQIDVIETLDAVERGDVPQSLLDVNGYTDQILSDLENIDPSYRVWLLARRRHIHDRITRALEEILRGHGQPSTNANRAAEALIRLDPTHEEATRHLMREAAASGQPTAALRYYEDLWDLLGEQYDTEPSAETKELVASIKMDEFESPPKVSAAPAIARPEQKLVLAIEPIRNEAVPDDLQHLVYGFRHMLMACFVRFREWNVMDLDGPLAGPDRDNASFVVRGSAIRGENGVELVVTLKDVRTDILIWSDQVTLDVHFLGAIHQSVVRNITTALNVHLSARRAADLTAQPEIEAPLYESWLRGQSMIMQLNPQAWRTATKILDGVVQRAPDFAPAYSSLAQLHNAMHIVHPGIVRTTESRSTALSMASSAAQLDPIDSRTQLCLAWAYAFDEQFEPAGMHFDLARGLNDHDAWTLMSSAQGFAFLSDFDEATRMMNRSLECAPRLTPIYWSYLAGIRFFLEDYEGALQAGTRAGDILANNGAWRAAALSQLGRHDEAVREAAICLEGIRARWHGADDPSDEDITEWIMQLFPIRTDTSRSLFRNGLAGAGFPVTREAITAH